MKRSGPLQRKTPLNPGTKGLNRTSLAPGKPILRRTPMPRPRPARDDESPEKPAKPPTAQAVRLRAQEARFRAARKVVERRAQGQCEHCSRTLPPVWHAHHRDPRGMGGSSDPAIHSPANLLALHPSCHLEGIEKDRAAAEDAGWLVTGDRDPAAVPVLYRGVRWVLLDADGGVTDVERPAQ